MCLNVCRYGRSPGVFIHEETICLYLSTYLSVGAPPCFQGTYQRELTGDFLIARSGERYQVCCSTPSLIRQLRAATKGIARTDGGGIQMHLNFAIIQTRLRSQPPGTSQVRWILVDAVLAPTLIRSIEMSAKCAHLPPSGNCSFT